MRITGITYGLLHIPLRTPFKTALRTVETMEDVVIRVETDTGHVGYGEAPPTVAISIWIGVAISTLRTRSEHDLTT